MDCSCWWQPSTHCRFSALSSLVTRRQIGRSRSFSPNTSPSSNKASAPANSSICSVPEGVATERCGDAPVALSSTSVTSATVSICSRGPRWRATACASAMNSRNNSRVAYDMIYAPTDPRLTSIFHDVRLERTYVHHADGFDLLASETLPRLTIPLGPVASCSLSRVVHLAGPSAANRASRRRDQRITTNPARSTCPSSPRFPPTRHG